MPEVPIPLSTAPGVYSTESGGRLINAFCERAAAGSRSTYRWSRVPGLAAAFETIPGHRGHCLVGSVLYVVSDETVFSIVKAGSVYTVTPLTGDAVGGVGPVTMARNMAAVPNVLIVHSDGMSEIDTSAGTVADFVDADLPQLNSICFLDGYFIGTAANGRAYPSGLNDTAFAGTDYATAEADPDGLVRAIARGRDLLLMGASTIEFWANVGNPTGFPFSRGSVVPVGLLTATAVAGHETGWGSTPIFVANDRTVMRIDGYSPIKISPEWLDRRLEAVADVTGLQATAFVAAGHRFWALSGADWTAVYDLSMDKWHERKSYGLERWRIDFCAQAFGEWLAFDRDSAKVLRVDAKRNREDLDPLVWTVRTAQVHAFPSRIEVNRVGFDFETGVGLDAGISPIQTEPRVFMRWSDDGGRTWSQALDASLGTEGEIVTVQFWRGGTSGPNGRMWELSVSDPVNVSLMGGAWDGQVVG